MNVFVPDFTTSPLIVAEIFHLKPQMSTLRWRQRENQGLTNVIRIYPLGESSKQSV